VLTLLAPQRAAESARKGLGVLADLLVETRRPRLFERHALRRAVPITEGELHAERRNQGNGEKGDRRDEKDESE
jgi:hypothetical protein